MVQEGGTSNMSLWLKWKQYVIIKFNTFLYGSAISWFDRYNLDEIIVRRS